MLFQELNIALASEQTVSRLWGAPKAISLSIGGATYTVPVSVCQLISGLLPPTFVFVCVRLFVHLSYCFIAHTLNKPPETSHKKQAHQKQTQTLADNEL